MTRTGLWLTCLGGMGLLGQNPWAGAALAGVGVPLLLAGLARETGGSNRS